MRLPSLFHMPSPGNISTAPTAANWLSGSTFTLGTFKTTGHPPPGVETGPATNISQNSAVLNGVVNPNGQATSWTFQWGTTTNYSSATTGGALAAASSAQNVASPLTGLNSGTVYHYRLIATHGSRSSSG